MDGLIETLWNVKLRHPETRQMTSRFNRNIVECKGFLQMEALGPEQGLIETLWNVKIKSQNFTHQIKAGLIETLWNVKRYILAVNISFLGLIETLWNVKTAAFATSPTAAPV